MDRKEASKKSPIDVILDKILAESDDEIDAWNYVIEYGMMNSDWLSFWREQNL
jgi:hypothetical protein